MREIVFYRTPSGRTPASEFILSLAEGQRESIAHALEEVRAAQRLPRQMLKKLPGTDSLWEVRVKHRRNAFRLLCFFDGPKLVVVVSGFAKKSMQLPRAEIQTAQERRRDYLRRKATDG